ncbi:MAG TPA: hypothetical protein VIA98_11030 [Allosphingosinicella sp.]|jgi:hypothetical protein
MIHDNEPAAIIELGSATWDTQGAGGTVMEGSDYRLHAGMSDD